MKKALLMAPMGSVHRRFNMLNIEALQAKGYEVHLLANFELGEGTEHQNAEFAQICREKGIVVHSLPFKRHSLLGNIRLIKKIKELLQKESFSVVHTHTETGGLLLRMCGKSQKDTCFIYTPHGMSFYEGSSFKSQLIYRPIEYWICKGMDDCIAINEEEMQTLVHWNVKNAHLVHGVGLDLQQLQNPIKLRAEIREELGVPQDAFMILSIGELNENKNHRVVIEALSQMQQNNIYYVICGVGEKKEELLNLAKQQNIEKKVILAGYRSDIPDIVHAADCFAFPSYHEGLPVSVMEAMAGGLSVVCSDIRGNRDLIEENVNGFLVPPQDVDAWKHGLQTIYSSIDLQKRFKQENLKCIEQYSWTSVKKELLEIYR